MEQAALTQLLARKELMVLATGGGIVSEPLTFDLILSSFYTIWLKAEPEEHMARVRGQGDLRPMADDRSAMAELAQHPGQPRAALCASFHAVVDTAGLSVDAAAARLSDAVAPVLHDEHRRSGCAAQSPEYFGERPPEAPKRGPGAVVVGHGATVNHRASFHASGCSNTPSNVLLKR